MRISEPGRRAVSSLLTPPFPAAAPGRRISPILRLTCTHPASRFYLRDSLQRKIREEIKWDSKWGVVKQLLIPLNGLLLTNTFDLDLDTGTVAQDVATELSTVFSPQEYRVVDSIMEGKFADGKALLKVIF